MTSKGKRQLQVLDFFRKKPRVELTPNSDDELPKNPPVNKDDDELQSQYEISRAEHEYDIANFPGIDVANSRKVEILEKLWQPTETFQFPSSGNRNLKFQHKWFHQWKWLSYSKEVDGAYCKCCVLFNTNTGVGLGKHQKVGQLCTEKFCNWKKAKERFTEHQTREYHQHNVENAALITNIVKGKQDPINLQLNQEEKNQILENRKTLEPIIETVLLCGKQGLALRGHRDGGRIIVDPEKDDNEGNFREILRYRAKYDETLQRTLLNSKRNALYTSWNIQNEIIEISNDLILQKLITKINLSGYFSVLVDETTDISTTEQMSLCIRCVDPSFTFVEELFLQFIPIEDVTGKGIATAIVDNLKRLGIDVSKMRGQGYDGAAAMSGQFNGVQAHVRALYPQAIYVHCVAHSLNLAVSNSCEVSAIRNCLGTIETLYNFFHTPKRQLVLEESLKELEVASSHEKIKRLCATRWVERYNSVMVFVELFDGIILALHKISEWPDKESANAAHQLDCTLKKAEFVIALSVINQVFSYSSILCKMLQQRNIDLRKAANLAEDTIAEIKKLREDAKPGFAKLFAGVQEQAGRHRIDISQPRITSKQTNRCNVEVSHVEDYFRVSIYIPFLDAFLGNLEDRFTKHKEILMGFQCLLPTNPHSLTDKTLEEFKSLILFYKDDLNGSMDELTAELKLWYRLIAKLDKQEWPKDALSAIKYCADDVFPNIKTLLHILAVLPVSTAENERSFSTLRRLKNYLRNATSETRLNGLTLLHIFRELTPSVESILNKMSEKPRKLKIKL
ncbi:zinc finger MYM-type protein 1-like [Photinus pyralis]|uniref:zinc finger MYM-type protein 1-like n=1 Tax=Photinus pyralis TaxID=7054 RepID=UPI0012673E02|nr:zinc finger MYM-type protein 1-like [Photinus pyralis]